METAFEKITLDFYEEDLQKITEGTPGGMYWGQNEAGHFEISLARTKLEKPEEMIATLAHEIAHIKLLGENKIDENDEPLTDLATIFFGFGVFNANAAFNTFADNKYHGWSTSGYLTQMEWGYALALFAHYRQEENAEWVNYLCKNVEADFLQGLDFIHRNNISVIS